MLAGVSLTWYTWLEQGRQVRASERVLENISTTLRLNAAERDYLFSLVQNRPAPLVRALLTHLPPSIQRTIDALNIPALIMTMRWDVVAWNAMVTATFRDYGAMSADRRNLIKLILSDPRYLSDAKEYEMIARRILSKLRVDYSLASGDPEFDALIAELTDLFPIFAKLWSSTEISARSEGLHTFRHEIVGNIDFEHTSYTVEGLPTLRLVIFAPQNAESTAKLQAIADSLVHPQETLTPSNRAPRRTKSVLLPS